jgi:ATP synthase subunit 6
MYISPFEQFKVFEVLKFNENYNFVITNSILQIIVVLTAFLVISYFTLSSTKNTYEIPFYFWIFKELYSFVYNTIYTYVGKKTGLFFPFIFFLFLFIFMCNLVGLVPYSFTVTSHFAITFGLGFTVWFGVILLGIKQWGIQFFSIFFPKGSSAALVFFIAAIEFLSYSFRVLSISLRLLANMVAGHILLDCISFFIFKSIFSSIAGSSVSVVSTSSMAIPLIFLLILLIFEMCVAVLQAYIFIVLSCMYIKEVL